MTALFPRTSTGLILFYNFILQSRGVQYPPHLVPVAHALMDKRIHNLLIVCGPGSGKSLVLSQIYPSFEIGHDPTTTVLGLSAGEALMQGFLGAVQECITTPEWAAAFPGVGPDYNRGWSSERGIFVQGHGPGDPDANYFVAGITSKSYTGKHARIILGDDLHDRENSMSAEACLRVRETYYRQIPGRADPRGARFIFAGRRWHEDDLYGHLKDPDGNGKRCDFVVMELPAVRKVETLYWDVTVPDGMECCFTDGIVPSVRLDD